jgi:hypothetical protein
MDHNKLMEVLIAAVKYPFRFWARPYSLICRRTTRFGPSYSDAGQDLMVKLLLGSKTAGIFVEIGSQDPIKNNNTFLLETSLDWSGIAFELRSTYVRFYNWRRRNPCIQGDATKIDYRAYFRERGYPPRIDFLQVDIEPAQATLDALRTLPHDEYRFSIIAFEHDGYQNDNEITNSSRSFLMRLGYHLLVENVMIRGAAFEDWWIDPTASSSFLTLAKMQLASMDYSLALEELTSLKKMEATKGQYGIIQGL